VLGIVAACDRFGSERGVRFGARVNTDSMGVPAVDVSTIALRGLPELIENSGVVMSLRQRGVLFSINDSDNEPTLFAFDTTGENRGVWSVVGSTNVDWEAVTVGPCPGSRDCVYIGDVGDNDRALTSRAIYRVGEPRAIGGRGSVVAERLSYSYEDGPHDVEAMYVTAYGEVVLITKRRLRDSAGKLRPALIYSLPAAAWSAHRQAVARLVDSLPLVPGSAPLDLITDAGLSPDRRHLAVRTYVQAYLFATDPLTGRLDHSVAPTVCSLVPLGEPQGEGIAWADDRGRLVMTSEGDGVPIHLASCPIP